MPLTPILSKSKWPEGADQGISRFRATSAIGGAEAYGFRVIVRRTASASTAAATRTDTAIADPLHLNSTEHPFMVERYEGCLAAHLLLSADLQRSLKEQQQYFR